jgi:chaperonin GroES
LNQKPDILGVGEITIMNVHPLRDFIVVSKDASTETRSPGGLVLVKVVENVVTGSVLAVGSGKVSSNGTSVPLEVAVGDKVVFNSNVATELKSDDGAVFLLREDNVLAVLK